MESPRKIPAINIPSLAFLLFILVAQVAVAKKKAEKKVKETSEEVTPQTVTEQVTEAINEALKLAGQARTSAITLSGLEFAENLSQAMKDHANKIESLYGQVQKAIKEKKSDKELARFIGMIESEDANTKKLQARPALTR